AGCRIVHEHAEIVGAAGELVDLDRHEVSPDCGRNIGSGDLPVTLPHPFLQSRTVADSFPPMNSDIIVLRSFYGSVLGRLAERSITMALASIWAKLPKERLVGLGYTVPWLDRFGTDAECACAFMPATQG